MANPFFSQAAVNFLRGLARHNDRTWFEDRRDIYEQELKAPMLALIEEINTALASFAPEHMRPPHKAMMRIFRDTRFSTNKTPYKTRLAAWWSRDGLPKTSGAGFYFHWGSDELVIAAGVYKPEKDQLLAIRRYLADYHAGFYALLRARPLKAAFDKELDGAKLSRPPKGFAGAPPEAMPLLLHQQWGVSATLPSEAGTSSGLVKDIATRFRAAVPLVRLLNTPLLGAHTQTNT